MMAYYEHCSITARELFQMFTDTKTRHKTQSNESTEMMKCIFFFLDTQLLVHFGV